MVREGDLTTKPKEEGDGKNKKVLKSALQALINMI